MISRGRVPREGGMRGGRESEYSIEGDGGKEVEGEESAAREGRAGERVALSWSRGVG